MKWRNVLKLIAVLTLILVTCALLFVPIVSKINLGLDLQGGIHVVLEAKDTPEHKVTNEDMNQLREVMTQRVDALGVSEPTIQRVGEKRLIVELAGIKDVEQAMNIFFKTALLEFKTSDGKVILTGQDLKNAQARYDQNNTPEINLEFNDKGAKTFAETTGRLAKLPAGSPDRVISIVLDNEVLQAPHVNEAIPNGQARITGGFASFDDAAKIAALLRAGALPVKTDVVEKRIVGPSLGLDSLEKSETAVIIGLTLVAIFMLLLYRLPGLIADVTLVIFAILVLAGMLAIKAVLTLPGIAAMLLTVAMAADANILIIERIKDEFRSGKTIRASVEGGFKRAIWTILDSNITTIIAAVVLFYFGSGAIRGFALTLIIGIVINLFTAITLSRVLLRMVVSVPALQNKKFFGL